MSRAAKEEKRTAAAIFTPEGFVMDFPEGEDYEKPRRDYRERPWKTLYRAGFEPEREEPETLRWLHRVALAYAKSLTSQPALEITREQTEVPLEEEVSAGLLDALPYGLGTEYVTRDWLQMAWEHFTRVFREEIAAYEGTVELYFAEKLQDLRIPERVFFHLVESKKDEYPFVFLATYSTRDANGKVQHQPLSYALVEYKKSREKLAALLACLNRAADVSPLIGEFMASGELLHPLRLEADEAYAFLKSVPEIENAGICCRLPDWWRKKASTPKLTVKVGEKKDSFLGFDTLLSMTPEITVDGVKLTREDIKKLLAQSEGLALLKGKWVEVDHEKLRRLLSLMESYRGDLGMLDALRMQGGMAKERGAKEDEVEITNGKWFAEVMEKLRRPAGTLSAEVPDSVQAQLRPYQVTGYQWLSEMASFGLGACLADDMGLGKTLQVLTFLERLHREQEDARVLLVVPASLMGNWEREAGRFTPDLTVCRLHGQTSAKLGALLEESDAFLTITTYGMVNRLTGLQEREWTCLILDEAQAIKNPGVQQTKAVKKLRAKIRIAMTGTPIENDLGNLWSLFDFLNKGLLGTSKEFTAYTKELSSSPQGYAGLKRMVSPFILRRLKTDKTILSDLPDKVEMTDYVGLSKRQITLYNKAVSDLAKKLGEVEPKDRSSLVLSSITRFKQLCNHPDQYEGQETFTPSDSGKFEALSQICETIRDKHERVLVFTQYREITDPLDEFLARVFGRKGLVLHGSVRPADRQKLVEQFNGEEYVPYMILTLGAGGTGLNLVGANHVVLFDRWWNPAVEAQAVDRAFRIGQTKDVMVHKFVTRGTIEEKIAEMLASKAELARNIVGEGSESWISDLDNEELLRMLKLEG